MVALLLSASSCVLPVVSSVLETAGSGFPSCNVSSVSHSLVTGNELLTDLNPPDLPYSPSKHGEKVFYGVASYYRTGTGLSDKTASGEPLKDSELTAAHPNLPFGTKLLVTNLANGRTVLVRVNDRGPFSKRRVLDLSLAAAHHLNMIQSGLIKVKIEVTS
ncbi:MAG TPA: septal ring lytic transglycosylase RlpA family protein [Oligoflexia bacterium]|nr:septal ring lytic transglycosylase RlpA family protein [Oligoflexia bacterium]